MAIHFHWLSGIRFPRAASEQSPVLAQVKYIPVEIILKEKTPDLAADREEKGTGNKFAINNLRNMIKYMIQHWRTFSDCIHKVFYFSDFN